MQDALPIIDLALLGEGDGASLTRIAAAAGAACRDVGFFYVVNHSVDLALIAQAFAQSHAFFALPVVDKRKLAIETIGGNRGYSGLLHEALDPARGPDMKEAFNSVSSSLRTIPNCWRESLFARSTPGPAYRASAIRCCPTMTLARLSARDCIAPSPATLA